MATTLKRRGAWSRRGLLEASAASAGLAALSCTSTGDATNERGAARRGSLETRAESDADAAKDSGGAEAAERASPVHEALLTWLDPEATAIAYARLEEPLDLGALAHLYGLPPRLTELLERVDELDWSLSALFPAEAPAPSSLFHRGTLCFRPGVGTGTYLVRRLSIPEEELRRLTGDRMLEGESDGVSMLKPRGAFGYRLAFLGDGIVGFIPVSEIGSGLSPLTAGRDLPASVARAELGEMLRTEPTVVLTAVAAGPMLHLDLDEQVARARLVLRSRPPGARAAGYDGESALELVAADASDAADRLNTRESPLETDAMQALLSRVAFTASGPVVGGRLQLTRDDVDQVRRDP